MSGEGGGDEGEFHAGDTVDTTRRDHDFIPQRTER